MSGITDRLPRSGIGTVSHRDKVFADLLDMRPSLFKEQFNHPVTDFLIIALTGRFPARAFRSRMIGQTCLVRVSGAVGELTDLC